MHQQRTEPLTFLTGERGDICIAVGESAVAYAEGLGSHYRVYGACAEHAPQWHPDSIQIADRIEHWMQRNNLRNAHLLVDQHNVGLALELLGRGQSLVSWNSAVLVLTPVDTFATEHGWLHGVRRLMTRWRKIAPQRRHQQFSMQNQLTRLRRSLQVPKAVIGTHRMHNGYRPAGLFRDAEFVPVPFCTYQFTDRLADAIVEFHRRLRTQRRSSGSL